ncbi:hypothetical protein D477_013506 [Arthrobacter crystallopoietes BAB-32]|uniref:Uncharacterized protein n=1 Tax=Arthrobacter crystallopoietes BAB-32 TaxID=1246476 RepID=N1UXA7_9MICC|nr:hypothetical protein [Arthrobacter crystallopoietes]EMY33685.1 hypothetical protein D477_013506 [Arthrobacter crystallopoietes BAB-32]
MGKIPAALITCALACGTLLPAAQPAAAATATTVVAVGSTNSKALFNNAGGYVASNKRFAQHYYLKNIKTNRTGALQESRGGKWVTVQRLTWRKQAGFTNSTAVTVRTTSTAATVTKKYRLVVNATKQEKQWISATATLRHQNPRHYTGYKRTVYNTIKKYCPDVIILEENRTRSYTYSTSLRMNVARRPAGQLLKYAALHECAHIRQFSLYLPSQQPTLHKKLNAIYKTTRGVEMAADCMAFRMGVNSKLIFGTYTKNCSGARGTAAAKLLAGRKL